MYRRRIAHKNRVIRLGWLWATILSLGLLCAGAPSVHAWPEVDVCKGALEASDKGGCEGISYTGCCDIKNRLFWCQQDDLYCIDCADGFDLCGWNSLGYYDCGQPQALEDPSGANPLSCQSCSPGCTEGAACSPDCPGGCGVCGEVGSVCLDDGTCYTPQCAGMECGSDPLGFSCGHCPYGTECVEGMWQCLDIPAACLPKLEPGCPGCPCEACVCDLYPSCCTEHWDLFCATACEIDCGASCTPCPAEPSCEGLECGSYCGVDCGSCLPGSLCLDFKCCTPNCTGKVCGSDGCSGQCGTCEGGLECLDGACVECQPKCAGKSCGDDGCGGICGNCPDGKYCVEGQCSISPCDSHCDEGPVSCGPSCECYCDEDCFYRDDCCEGICSVCATSFPDICCQPDCEAKLCGDDGCGGSCGGCPPGQACDSFSLCAECTPSCEGKVCGDDACGSTCGSCSGSDLCDDDGQCIACVPECEGKVCGDDGCGGSCGGCESIDYCDQGSCVVSHCQGQCGTIELDCGDDCLCSCGPLCFLAGNCCPGICDACSEDLAEQCCEPQCDGKFCGDNGCGGYCGTCKNEQNCIEGICVTCHPQCVNIFCGDDGCGGTCGSCTPGYICEEGSCTLCEPTCGDHECGSNGCGGICGSCGLGKRCEDGLCELATDCGTISAEGACSEAERIWCDNDRLQVEDCALTQQTCAMENGAATCVDIEICEPQCKGKECGEDGCGDYCGTCPHGQLCQSSLCEKVGVVEEDIVEVEDNWRVIAGDESDESSTTRKSSGCAAHGHFIGTLYGVLFSLAWMLWAMRYPCAAPRKRPWFATSRS